jgi:riboflavin synthase
MFTGIIEDLGTVAAVEPREAGMRIRVQSPKLAPSLEEGTSIAVNGVCLTARDVSLDSFSADLAPETLSRSNLGELGAGSRVNLERPVTPATLLSGHIVQGHIDAKGEIAALDALGAGNAWLKVRVPDFLDRYLVEKGSIALDGISLTIAALEPGPVVYVAVIPHTLENTTLGHAKPGARINIEVDVLAKHVEKLLSANAIRPEKSSGPRMQ